MCRHASLSTAAAMLVILGTAHAPGAQTSLPEFIGGRSVLSEGSWTILTMAPDGSWGVATSISIGRAIAGAMADCKAMSQAALGCGYKSKAIQAGWLLGVRCGGENILVADRNLANAELAALNRETELRQIYAKEMPPCVRVVTVDPQGLMVAF